MAALQRMHEQPEQGAHDGAEDQAVAGQHQGGDQWFDPVEQPEDPPDQRADQGAGASTAQRGGAVVHRAEDLFHVLQFPADDGHLVYLETLVGQVVDRAFGVGVVVEGGDHLAGGLIGPHRRSRNRRMLSHHSPYACRPSALKP